MKRIVVATAVLGFALSVQAAAVAWNSGASGAGFTDPDGKKITTAMGYTMTAYFYSDSAGNTLVTSSEATTANALTGNITATTSDVFSGETTYYVKAIIANDSYTRETELVAFSTPTTGNASINFTTGAGLSSGSSAWSSGGWQAVPEPTSGLLLLLGVAGLALKRKKA